MGIGERIQYYLDLNDMQQKELAEKIWINPVVLNRIIKNHRPIRGDELSAIAKVFNITTDELLGKKTPIITNLQPIENMRRVPIIGLVRCGAGACAYEDIDEYITIDDTYRPDEMRGFRAEGDSMEPEIHDGDICLVHLQEEVPDGALAVVVICDGVEDCEGTIKRIHKADGAVILQATNPAYPPRIFTGEKANRVRIVGRVVEVRHKTI
jgi:repressor LexA